jgi:hypothetical protein
MDAAKAALDAGALSVPLSQGGCVRLTRTLSNGTLAHEEISFAGQPGLVYDFRGNEASGRIDADLDGFFETTLHTVLGAQPSGDLSVTESFRPSDHELFKRATYTRMDDVVHVLVEEADTTGALHTTAQYDTDRYQPNMGSSIGKVIAYEPCSDQDLAAWNSSLKTAMDHAIECLRGLGMDRWSGLQEAFLAGVEFRCDSNAPLKAMFDGHTWFAPGKATEIVINPGPFDQDAEQAHDLLHEMLHGQLGLHIYDAMYDQSHATEHFSEIDRVEACTQLCGLHPEYATKCDCAMCLGTNLCDPRCAGFRKCARDPGQFICPNKNGPYGKTFSTCDACTSACQGVPCALLPDLSCKRYVGTAFGTCIIPGVGSATCSAATLTWQATANGGAFQPQGTATGGNLACMPNQGQIQAGDAELTIANSCSASPTFTIRGTSSGTQWPESCGQNICWWLPPKESGIVEGGPLAADGSFEGDFGPFMVPIVWRQQSLVMTCTNHVQFEPQQ